MQRLVYLVIGVLYGLLGLLLISPQSNLPRQSTLPKQAQQLEQAANLEREASASSIEHELPLKNKNEVSELEFVDVRLRPDAFELVKLPPLTRPRPTRTTKLEELEIRNLIVRLAELEEPDLGLSPSYSGDKFSPLAHSTRVDTMIFGNDGMETFPPLRDLVALGPKALPFLLESLEDDTPTKLQLVHNGSFGVMCADRALYLNNPLNSRETNALKKFLPTEQSFKGKHIEKYTLKVGDVCYVAIGQIVGRNYLAARYQPTAIIILNCPSLDKQLAKTVRQIWSSDDANQMLFDSLWRDFATRAKPNLAGPGEYISDHLQCSAALRLLYYYPEESAKYIAQRLDSFQVETRDNVEDLEKVAVHNQVSHRTFFTAVNWCKHPLILAVLPVYQQKCEKKGQSLIDPEQSK